MEHVPRIDRAHERVLKKMFRTCVDVRPGIDQNEDVGFGRKNCRDAGTIDSGQRSQFNHARGNGSASMPRAHDSVSVATLHDINGATNRRIFLDPPSQTPSIAYEYELMRVYDLELSVITTLVI